MSSIGWFCLPKETVEEDLDLIVDEMLMPSYDWAYVVPLKLEVEAGPNWYEMEEVGEFTNADDIRS